MYELARKIYEACKDMDFNDYEETKEETISILVEELQKAKELKLNTILSALEILTAEVE